MKCTELKGALHPIWLLGSLKTKKLNIHLPNDPAIPLLGIYSREMKT